MTKHLMAAVLLVVGMGVATQLAPVASAGELKVIQVSGEKRQEMIYGMDFERFHHFGGLGKDGLAQLAKVAVADCNVSYVRVAIDGAAEFNEGEFSWDAYNFELQVMGAITAARPDIRFFASPRPFHEAIRKRHGAESVEGANAPYTCFPLWIGVFENPYDKEARKFVEFKWQKAADYLVRHVQFFKSRGFKISYIDAHNENTKLYRPAEVSKMLASMREQLADDMPQVIAPSGWSTLETINWVKEAAELGVLNQVDIIASHNTSRPNSTTEAQQELGALTQSLKKPLWNTEMHGFAGPDEQAVANSNILWSHVRAGFGGINDWLSLGNERKTHKMIRNVDGKLELMRIYYIFKHLVNTSNGGHHVDSSVPEGLTTTAAFVRGDTLSVWILNSGTEPQEIALDLSAYKTAGDYGVHWWDSDNGREGAAENRTVAADGKIARTLAADTLHCFTVKLKQD